MKFEKRTKGRVSKKCCFTLSNVEPSYAPAVLKPEPPTIGTQEYFETLETSNINRDDCSQFQHQSNKQSANIQQFPLFSASNNLEMAALMNQFGTFYREIKRIPSLLGKGLVNVIRNEEGLVMCSNCYYYTRIGESCWHCGNSC